MKNPIDFQLLTILCGGILLNYLFWMEGLGLNLLLYSIYLGAVIWTDKEVSKSKNMLLTGSAHAIASIAVVLNKSDLTITAWFITLAVFVGVTHFQSLRTIPAACLGAILQLTTAPLNLTRKIARRANVNHSFWPYLKPLKYLIIPFIALVLFSTLYSIANPIIATYMQKTAQFIADIFTHVFNFFFTELSFSRFLHLLLGIFLSAAVLIGYKHKTLEKIEALHSDELRRDRKKKSIINLAYELAEVFVGDLVRRKMALKIENLTGILSLLSLNVLIFLLDVLEVADLLQGNTADSQLSSELHGGTFALIISVVMAMLVILYFFSGNLNFYSKNQWIKRLAFLWIFQNAILVSLVLTRDMQYIETFGLTYKRIGVMLFLLLCTIGLVTVYIKVALHKTLFYLCRVNTLAWYLLLLSSGFVKWDRLIVNYNIANRHRIQLDLSHLMNLSDETLPVIHKNRNLLLPYLSSYGPDESIETRSADITQSKANGDYQRRMHFEEQLTKRIAAFTSDYEKKSWRSWNYRDWQTYHYLRRQQL